MREIKESFSMVTYPGGDNVVEYHYQCKSCELEVKKLVDASRGKKWEDIPVEIIEYQHDSLPFLVSHSYPFYIPAYMSAGILQYFFRSCEDIMWNTVCSLCRQSEELHKGIPIEKSCDQHYYLSLRQRIIARRYLILA